MEPSPRVTHRSRYYRLLCSCSYFLVLLPKFMTNGDALPPFLTDEQKQLLRKSAMCSKLSDDQFAYFLGVTERTRLDPFVGQIRPDVRNSTSEGGQKEPTLLIIVTLQGLRVIGDRSGQLDGESGLEWAGKNGEWHDSWTAEDSPVVARASVHRKDRKFPFTAVCRWDA